MGRRGPGGGKEPRLLSEAAQSMPRDSGDTGLGLVPAL